MRRRRATAITLSALVVASAGAIAAVSLDGNSGGSGARAAAPSRGGTATVKRRTLIDRQQVDGTLGYAGKRAATNRLSGTITWLPHAGAVIRPGQTLFKVDGKPVVLMDGTLPAYRSLRAGVTDGADVRQLERGLARLGYEPGTVDDHYSAATAAAVRAWEGAMGLKKTGRVELGRIVFLPGARRVTDLKVSLGSTSGTGGGGGDNSNNKFASYTQTTTPTETTPTQTTPTETTPTETTPTQTTPQTAPEKKPKRRKKKPTAPKRPAPAKSNTPTTPAASNDDANPNNNNNGDNNANSDANAPATDVLMTTSTRRVVTAKVDVADQTLVAKGRAVRVELPDGRIVAGRITNVGTVATSDNSGNNEPGGGDSTPTITITIRLRSARAAGRLDQAPVSVQISRTTRRNALAVPVQALVARRGGRYAVERADGRLVNVTPGLFANGYVEIVGGALREGDRVRVPR
ncbi:MAG TPA: peptidoglycan-binding protein [Thermoleophilaceae bacterium]